jgi:hypothetical protein
MQTVRRRLRGALLFCEEPKAMEMNGNAGRVLVLPTTSFTLHSLPPYLLLPHSKHVTLSSDGNEVAGHFIYML